MKMKHLPFLALAELAYILTRPGLLIFLASPNCSRLPEKREAENRGLV